MIHNEAGKIQAVMEQIDGVRSVTRGWPKTFAEETLPCVAVSKAADTPVDFRDGKEHIAEVEYYIRVYALRTSQVDEIAPQVDEAMEAMGYVRTFSYDDDESDMRIQSMRYRKFM